MVIVKRRIFWHVHCLVSSVCLLMFGDSNGGGGSSNNNNKQQYKISNEWCIDCYVIVSYLSCYFTRPSQTKWTDCENCLKRVWVCLWMCVCLHVCMSAAYSALFSFFFFKKDSPLSFWFRRLSLCYCFCFCLAHVPSHVSCICGCGFALLWSFVRCSFIHHHHCSQRFVHLQVSGKFRAFLIALVFSWA